MVPNRLVGVSSGAIVATLYCAGMQPEDMLKFVMDSSMLRVIKFGIPLTGLTNLDYLKERLSLIWSLSYQQKCDLILLSHLRGLW